MADTAAPATPQDVLNLPLSANDANAPTIRAYLVALLAGVWQEGEGFNGKRPFGNSGWQSDFDKALIQAGYVKGLLDPDGWVDEVDSDAVDALIAAAILALADDADDLIEDEDGAPLPAHLQWPGSRHYEPAEAGTRPKIVTLCGSTRFKDEINAENARLTMGGSLVISLGVFGHTDMPGVDWTTDGSTVKRTLDDLHKRKIDLADRVHVVNPGGYIGESTRGEIAYAEAHGKPVTYLEPVEEQGSAVTQP